MKVRDCRNCVHFCDECYSLGFRIVKYGYCKKHEKPCREVKKCSMKLLSIYAILRFLDRLNEQRGAERTERLVESQRYAIAHIEEKFSEMKAKGIPITKHNLEKAALELQQEYFSKEKENNGKL